jgi:hypothetical protein
MPFLIDGHNLIGQTPGLRLDDPDDELKLVELLRGYLARVKKKGTVVFDRAAPGEQPKLSRGRLSVQFARAPRTADDVILELVRRERNPRGLTVITSDQRVMNAVRQARANVKASTAFAREMLAAPSLSVQKEKGLSAAEVEAWEKEFSASKKRSE